MAHDVFISYSTKNTEFAEAVCENLEDNGIECWIAPRNIKTGTNYAKEIIDGLNAAKIVVLVFSKDAQESEYVNNEIDTAFSNNQCIVSLKVDDSFPEKKMEFFLKNTQWLDASPTALKEQNKTLESCYAQLVDDVKRVLKHGCGGGSGHVPGQHIPQKEKSFFEKHKLPIVAAIIVLIAIAGFVGYSSMNGQSSTADANETALSIGYIGIEDNGNGNHACYVFGTIADDFSNSSSDVIHIDYYNNDGKVVETSDNKIGDIEGNILGSIEDTDKNITKVSVELKDKDGKSLYSEESSNVINQ